MSEVLFEDVFEPRDAGCFAYGDGARFVRRKFEIVRIVAFRHEVGEQFFRRVIVAIGCFDVGKNVDRLPSANVEILRWRNAFEDARNGEVVSADFRNAFAMETVPIFDITRMVCIPNLAFVLLAPSEGKIVLREGRFVLYRRVDFEIVVDVKPTV